MEARVCDLFHQDWRQPAFSADWRGSNLQIAPKPREQGPEPCPERVGAEGNAEGASVRDFSARHLIPVLEIGPYEDSQPSDRGQHRSAHRRPVGRLGAAEDALRRRLWRLVRADHAQGGLPGLREEARRQGRVRRRQLDRHAGQAAGAEGQPAIDVAIVDDGPMYQAIQLGFCGTIAGPRQEPSSIDAALFKDDKAVAVGQIGTGFMTTPRSSRRRAGPTPTSWNDLKDPEVQEAAGHPADQQHLRPLHADDVSRA